MIVGCAGRTNLTDNRKYFTDGSAGSTYPNNLDCEWWITPTTPVGEINLYFSEFEVAEGDYVAIWSACVVAAAATFHSFHSSFTASPANRWRVYIAWAASRTNSWRATLATPSPVRHPQ